MSSVDDYLSLKATDVRKIRTNTDVAIVIDGRSQWEAETPSGRHILAGYWNLDLPPAGSEARRAICRGGVRTWFVQVPENDITGLDGPWVPAEYGDAHLLISRVWPHTVDRSDWRFMIRVYAFDAAGNPVDLELELETREIKIIGDKS
jgi:hypothetical protein